MINRRKKISKERAIVAPSGGKWNNFIRFLKEDSHNFRQILQKGAEDRARSNMEFSNAQKRTFNSIYGVNRKQTGGVQTVPPPRMTKTVKKIENKKSIYAPIHFDTPISNSKCWPKRKSSAMRIYTPVRLGDYDIERPTSIAVLCGMPIDHESEYIIDRTEIFAGNVQMDGHDVICNKANDTKENDDHNNNEVDKNKVGSNTGANDYQSEENYGTENADDSKINENESVNDKKDDDIGEDRDTNRIEVRNEDNGATGVGETDETGFINTNDDSVKVLNDDKAVGGGASEDKEVGEKEDTDEDRVNNYKDNCSCHNENNNEDEEKRELCIEGDTENVKKEDKLSVKSEISRQSTSSKRSVKSNVENDASTENVPH